MKIPNKLKIGAHVYEVVVAKDLFEGTTCGIQLRKDNKIGINAELPVSHQGATLLHEILHAINSELDHTILDSLAEQLYQVLSDNRMLK
jgi:hypothetical protein